MKKGAVIPTQNQEMNLIIASLTGPRARPVPASMMCAGECEYHFLLCPLLLPGIIQGQNSWARARPGARGQSDQGWNISQPRVTRTDTNIQSKPASDWSSRSQYQPLIGQKWPKNGWVQSLSVWASLLGPVQVSYLCKSVSDIRLMSTFSSRS